MLLRGVVVGCLLVVYANELTFPEYWKKIYGYVLPILNYSGREGKHSEMGRREKQHTAREGMER